MKTLDTTATVTADGKLMADAPPGLEPGIHRVRLEIEEALAGADAIPALGRLSTYKGRQVITQEEMRHMDCPYPPEPEWEKEWEEARD